MQCQLQTRRAGEWEIFYTFHNRFPQICHPAKCVDEVRKECKVVEREECRIEDVIDLVDK